MIFSVMAGHSPSKTGVNALMPGHPRLASWKIAKEGVDARHKATAVRLMYMPSRGSVGESRSVEAGGFRVGA
jgi:hypothetical protein